MSNPIPRTRGTRRHTRRRAAATASHQREKEAAPFHSQERNRPDFLRTRKSGASHAYLKRSFTEEMLAWHGGTGVAELGVKSGRNGPTRYAAASCGAGTESGHALLQRAQADAARFGAGVEPLLHIENLGGADSGFSGRAYAIHRTDVHRPQDGHSLWTKLADPGGRPLSEEAAAALPTHSSEESTARLITTGMWQLEICHHKSADSGAPVRRATRRRPLSRPCFSSALSCATREPPLLSIWCGSGGRGARLSRSQLQCPGRFPPRRHGPG